MELMRGGATLARRSITAVVLVWTMVMGCAVCWGQDADSLMARSVRAMGNLSGIKSFYMEQEVNVAFMKLPVTMYIAPGKAYYMKTKVPMMGWMIQCAHDTVGWTATGKEGKMEVKSLRRGAVDSLLGTSLPFEAPFSDIGKVRLAGEKKFDGERCWVVEPVEETKGETKVYISKATGLLRGVNAEGEAKVTFDDYRSVQGMRIPHVMKVKSGMLTVTMKTTKVLINEPIDEKLLERPR